MTKRIISIFMIMALITLTFSGCFGKTKAGKAFLMPISDEPTSLDPQIVDSNSEKLVVSNCFEGLLRINENGELINGVAQSYSVSESGLSYTFKLRQDAKWSLFYSHEDLLGEKYLEEFPAEVTADDFVFGLRRALDPVTKSPDAYRFYAIKNGKKAADGKCNLSDIGVRATDKYTVQIDLDYADDNLLYSLTAPGAMPCNEKFFKATNGRYGLSQGLLLCNGPFYLSKWNEKASIKMSASSVYKGQTKALPSAVTLYYNDSEQSIAEKMGDKVYDVSFLTSSQLSKITDTKDLNISPILSTVYSLLFNRTGDLADADLRRAICYATDVSRPEMLPKDAPRADGLIPPFCVIKGEKFRDINKTSKIPTFNEAKAKEYFKKALLNLGKSSIEVQISCSPEYEELVKSIMGTWQRVLGVKFISSVEVLEKPLLDAKVKAKSHSIAFYPLTANSSNVDDFLNEISTSYDFISDPSYKAILDRIASDKSNLSKFNNSCIEAENYLLSNTFIMPVFYENSYFVTSKETNGIYYYLSRDNVYFINATKK